ncbi:O-antigen polymerase [Synechococcus sp. MVIR-18-1]|uniref:O-antigen polymerase n=1 Tax=Synechococcus sp. MVIR-18-1 TaxID=1386941 RepID=UPI0016456BD0|nr:O-antigen polymerase [Synechococcus sp. MVIR-18-1]
MAVLSYCLLYFVAPMLIPFVSECEPYCSGIDITVFIISVFGLLFLYLGFKFSLLLPLFRISKKYMPQPRDFYIFVFLLIAFSGGFLLIYLDSYGGLLNAISFGALSRFTGTAPIEVSSGAVALYFIGTAFIAQFISQWEIQSKVSFSKKWVFVFIVSVLISILFGLVNASRGTLMTVIIASLFVYLNFYSISFFSLRNSTFRLYLLLAVVFLFGLFFILNGKALIGTVALFFREDNLDYSSFEGLRLSKLYDRVILEIAFPFKSLSNVLKLNLEINWFYHFIVSPLHLIPTRLLGFIVDKPFRITEVNSFLLTGDPSRGIPPGILASFWYGGNFLGVILGMFLYGLLLGFIQKQGYFLIELSHRYTPIVLYIFFSIPGFVQSGDPSVFLKSIFSIFFLIFFLLFFSFFRRFKFYLSS